MSEKLREGAKRSSIWDIDERYRSVYVIVFAVFLITGTAYFVLNDDEWPNLLARVSHKVGPITLLIVALGYLFTEMVVVLMVLSNALSKHFDRKRKEKLLKIRRERAALQERERILNEDQVDQIVERVTEANSSIIERIDKVEKTLQAQGEQIEKHGNAIEGLDKNQQEITERLDQVTKLVKESPQ